MADKIFPQGVRFFKPRQGAPDFVKGSMVITLDDLQAWLIDNPSLQSEYNGKKQLKLDVLDGRDGLYVTVNTYRAGE